MSVSEFPPPTQPDVATPVLSRCLHSIRSFLPPHAQRVTKGKMSLPAAAPAADDPRPAAPVAVGAARHAAGGVAPSPDELAQRREQDRRIDLVLQVPKWQLPTSRDPAVLRAELEWLKAEDRAANETINELLADMKRAKPEGKRLMMQRWVDAEIARCHAMTKISATRDLLRTVEAAPWRPARTPEPAAAIAPSRGSGAANVADAAQRATAAASKANSADDDYAAEPVAPGCPSLMDAAAVLAPLRTVVQRVVNAACGVWFAGGASERATLSAS
jgi:hypothetical protein